MGIKRILGILIILAVAVGSYFVFFQKKEETKIITYTTSDAKNLRGDITIALDSWIGYFPLKSPVFGKLMRNDGYRIKIIDDRADYEKRMKLLKKGKIDFAVCTIDSYVLNGESANYPGIIVSIIDESKGGDAIVSWKRKIANIDQLKKKIKYKIAFTPASPSEHLLKSVAVHFGIPALRDKKGEWRIEVNGAEEAYKKLIEKKVDLAVLWEPHVTEATSIRGITKIIGSEDIQNLIVDILLVNRKFAEKKPDLIKLFLKNYFETLNIYKASPGQLVNDILTQVSLTKKKIRYMLKGVKWINYPENLSRFGLTSMGSHRQPEIIESINSTISILLSNDDFSKNPLPDKDPYTILNTSFIRDIYTPGTSKTISAGTSGDTLTKKFSKLSPEQWKKLRVIGALKLRPVTFRSGTSLLDANGEDQIEQIVNSIRHYPNFRILIKGHSGLRGDKKANMKLSLKRAAAVKYNLQKAYNIHPNRIIVKGIGSKEPLLKDYKESDRSFNSRLKRVEMLLLSGK